MAFYDGLISRGMIIFDKGAKNIQCRKENLYNKWCWENWNVTCKTIKLDYSLPQCTKINSKWITDLNIIYETLNYIEENIGAKLMDLDFVHVSFIVVPVIPSSHCPRPWLLLDCS